MDSPQFNVVINGSLLDGFEPGTVLLQLQQQLKLTEPKARMLIAGKTVSVKRGANEAVANAYCSRLRALGVDARIEPVATTNSVTTSTIAETPSTQTQIDTKLVTAATVRRPAKSYFSDTALTAKETVRASAFTRAVMRANLALRGVVSAYAALALLGLALLLFYVVRYAAFLIIPPVIFSATVYFIVSLTLVCIAALLWRPLLPQQHIAAIETPISPMQEPALYAFVAQLCEKLALKPPVEIVLTTAIANTASLLPGFKNIKHGEYRLALSLPILENSTLAQFAGVLAADLGTQTYLPMLRYQQLKRLVRLRLDDCLAKRDWLAQRIDLFAQKAPPSLNRLFQLLEKIIEQNNQYLQKIAIRIQSTDVKLQRPLLNEQDRYCALVSGSDHFAELMILQARIEAAARDANEKNWEDRIEGGLVDDLSALIRHYYENAEDNFARNLQRQWNSETTPRRDEPPIARERIELVSNSPKSSLIDNKESALSLLQQRDELARAITLDNYRQADLSFDPVALMPTDELTYTATQDILQRQQAAIYFNDWFKPFRFWSLADYKLISDMPLQDASMQLSVCVNEIRRLTPDRAKLLAEHERLQNQLREILIAQHVLAAGKKFSFRYVHYDGTTLVPILEDRQQELAAVLEKLAQQETVMGGRITLGLRLSGQDQREVSELHDALRMLHDIGARLSKIALDCFQLEQLLHRHHELREADYSLPIKKLETKIDDACTLIVVRLNDIPYPPDHRHRSLKSFVETILNQPQGKARSSILQRAQRLIDVLYRVNEKFSRQAADYGTIAEEAYRIEPIRLVNRP